MAVEPATEGRLVMPKLGLTMTEGTLAAWHVKPGDSVRAGDMLFTVETEKIANEIEASADGLIGRLLAAEGDVLPVGAVVATWSGPDMVGDSTIGEVLPPAPPGLEVRRQAPSRISGERVIATPLARRLARSRGIDLARIAGSGAGGRIKARDVESPGAERTVRGRRHAASPARRLIARRMTESKQHIPHFYVSAEVDVGEGTRLCRALNRQDGTERVTLTHLIVAAAGWALAQLPDMDRIWDGNDIVELGAADVGLVVDTPRGPMVPVLRAVGQAALAQIIAAAHDLLGRARSGTLGPNDMDGAALSVSNVGMHGAAMLVPIINPGQSAILGVGASRGVFRPDSDGAPTLCQELNLVLSCDHRIHDGVTAARYLGLVAERLARPEALI